MENAQICMRGALDWPLNVHLTSRQGRPTEMVSYAKGLWQTIGRLEPRIKSVQGVYMMSKFVYGLKQPLRYPGSDFTELLKHEK